jgi:hypothetical protein
MRQTRWQFKVNSVISTEALDGQGPQALWGRHGTPQNAASLLLHGNPVVCRADSKPLVNIVF